MKFWYGTIMLCFVVFACAKKQESDTNSQLEAAGDSAQLVCSFNGFGYKAGDYTRDAQGYQHRCDGATRSMVAVARVNGCEYFGQTLPHNYVVKNQVGGEQFICTAKGWQSHGVSSIPAAASQAATTAAGVGIPNSLASASKVVAGAVNNVYCFAKNLTKYTATSVVRDGDGSQWRCNENGTWTQTFKPAVTQNVGATSVATQQTQASTTIPPKQTQTGTAFPAASAGTGFGW